MFAAPPPEPRSTTATVADVVLTVVTEPVWWVLRNTVGRATDAC